MQAIELLCYLHVRRSWLSGVVMLDLFELLFSLLRRTPEVNVCSITHAYCVCSSYERHIRTEINALVEARRMQLKQRQFQDEVCSCFAGWTRSMRVR